MSQITSISVDYKHVDGWHVFSSSEVAGLYVASQDPERAYNDVACSIRMLLKLNEGLECDVVNELSFPDFVKAQHAAKGTKAVTHIRPYHLSSQRYAVSCM